MYFKLLELFILRTIFNKDEYKITSKNFNPIKFFIILGLVINVFFTIFLLNKLSSLSVKLSKECPSLFDIKKENSENKNDIKKEKM